MSLSDYTEWEFLEHAEDWILYEQNIGENLSIDETSLSQGELYTIITNKDAQGKKGALVAMIKGTESKYIAYTKLARWHNEVELAGFKQFNTLSKTIENHYQRILNFFDNRSTNASAESFNAKIKAFRNQFRGVKRIPFFLYRLAKIYA